MAISSQHVSYLERESLGTADLSPSNADLIKLSSNSLLRVSGAVRGGFACSSIDPQTAMVEALTGVHGLAQPLIFVVLHEVNSLYVYIGIANDSDSASDSTRLESLRRSLVGSLPGLELQELDGDGHEQLAEKLTAYTESGLLIGSPVSYVNQKSLRPRRIERLVQGLYGEAWAFVVLAQPAPAAQISTLKQQITEELRTADNQRQNRAGAVATIERYESLLDSLMNKLVDGQRTGIWHTAAYLAAKSQETLGRARSLAFAAYSGRESRPDSLRWLPTPDVTQGLAAFPLPVTPGEEAPGAFRYPYRHLSLLTSDELGALVNFPQEEAPGFFVREIVAFDAARRAPRHKRTLQVGEVLVGNAGSGSVYEFETDSLTRHGLVSGATGSGKTNTVFHLLTQLWRQQIPFLVIEPAKREYRSLIGKAEFSSQLRVFTLGDENAQPLHMNPLAILDGVSVQSHIDHILSLFNASFVMYAPMPYVLERCLHEVYQDRGWDLVTAENWRGRHGLAHPTLTDLHRKIGEVVKRLGYDRRLSADIRAALETRIQSLRMGGKGLMLDTHDGLSPAQLLAEPTVLELEHIASDEEKAFVMGLILLFLYERLRKVGASEGAGLQHLTVVEEAHRLLRHMPVTENIEAVSTRSQAVETFTNMLAEVRAYGEGFLIAEQIPLKLAPDVIKNTGFKVMHRMVAEDDRMLLGATMNMNSNQQRHIVALSAGDAAVFGEGDDGPLLVHVPYVKLTESVSAVGKRTPDSLDSPWNWASQHLRAAAGSYLSLIADSEWQQTLARCVLSALLRPESLLQELAAAVSSMARRTDGREETVGALLLLGLWQLFDDWGRLYGWNYPKQAQVIESWGELVGVFSRGWAGERRFDEIQQRLERLTRLHAELCSLKSWPFEACQDICPKRICLFRPVSLALMKQSQLRRSFDRATACKDGAESLWNGIADICLDAADKTLAAGVAPQQRHRAALCFAVHCVETSPQLDQRLRQKVVRNLWLTMASRQVANQSRSYHA